MSEYKIDDDVPLPPSPTGLRGKSKYPFCGLEVGQSFFAPGVDAKHKVLMRSAASNAARKIGHGVKFATRIVDGGVRVWRVS